MVWPFSSEKRSPKVPRKLPFKSGTHFFEYWCEFGLTEIVPRKGIVALVLDAKKEFGTEEAVKVELSGVQTAMLKVASKDGGFIVSAQTHNGKGAKLEPGDVVIWVPFQHIGDAVPEGIDDRFGWVGVIVAKIAPEINIDNSSFQILSHYAD